MEDARRLLLMGASLLSPSLTLLWAGLLGLGLLGGAGLPSHSRSERSVQLPAQGLICCSCGGKKRCVLHGPEVRSCSHVGVSFLFVSFPLEKRRELCSTVGLLGWRVFQPSVMVFVWLLLWISCPGVLWTPCYLGRRQAPSGAGVVLLLRYCRPSCSSCFLGISVFFTTFSSRKL